MNLHATRVDSRTAKSTVARTVVIAAAIVVSISFTASAELEKVGGEMQVNSYTTNYQRALGKHHVGMADDGRFVVSWQSYYQDGSGTAAAARRFAADGTPAGDDFVVNSTTTYLQGYPTLAAQGDGSFVVAWANDDYSTGSVDAQRFDSAGAASGGEFRADASMQQFPAYAAAAPMPGGGFVVAWDGIQSGLRPDVFARVFNSAGAPVTGQIEVNSALTDQRFPFVASNSDGDFVVVWTGESLDSEGTAVAAQRYDSVGTPVGTRFVVHTTEAGSQSEGAGLLQDDDTAVYVWTDPSLDGDSFSIVGRLFGSDGMPAGTEFIVNSVTTDGQDRPAIAPLPNNRFVVVWESQNADGDIGGIVAREFNADGSAAGDEILVNTYTSNQQTRPGVASAPDGTFVVTWTSYFQNGYYSDVFAQRMRLVTGATTTTTTAGNTTTTVTTTTSSTTTTTLPNGAKCSQPVSNGPSPLATDCLFILRVAVQLESCSPTCICAPGGSVPPAATDALVCLSVAVGTSGVTLNCPC